MGHLLSNYAPERTRKLANTTAILGISGVFTGSSVNTHGFLDILVYAISDVGSATNGLSVEQSIDGTNWDVQDQVTVSGGAESAVVVRVVGAFARIVYTNGGTGQASFRLYATLRARA